MERAEFPVKYLESNFVINSRTEEAWAYYEMHPYNYSCVSESKAEQISGAFSQLIARCGSKHLHFLMLNLEESIDRTIGRSKEKIQKGKLKGMADASLDEVGNYLKDVKGGENLIKPRFFIGFCLSGGLYEMQEKQSFREWASTTVGEFFREVNQKLGDYVKVSNAELDRYYRIEKLLYSRISKLFGFRRTQPRDMAYIIRHLNGQKGAYDEYDYHADQIKEEDETRFKIYDVIRLSSAKIINHDRSIDIVTEDGEEKVAFLAFSEMTGKNVFPYGSEILYYMQEDIHFPVDVSIMVECMENRGAIEKIRGKKAELDDLDDSAWKTGNRTSNSVYEANEDTLELEARLEKTREDMYKVSYLVRVSAKSEEELKRRVMTVKDVYSNVHMTLERPLCDQAGLHEEFYPSTGRYMDDYVQYVTGDFLAALGFGATQQLGEDAGIFTGWSVSTTEPVFIQPWLAAQGVAGSKTNALASAYLGSLGGGKSVAVNLHALWSTLYGSRTLVIDPKGERRSWEKDFSFLGNQLNILDVSAKEEFRGMFDPFYILEDVREAGGLARDVLLRLTGISMKDGERFPVLQAHIKKVEEYRDKNRGMLCIIEELKKTDTQTSRELAAHIESFIDLPIACLIFGDGSQNCYLDMGKSLNVILVQDLMLPESGTPVEQYSVTELLSVNILMMIAMFSLQFINQDREMFKLVVLDEAWSWLQVSEGKQISMRLVRAGRSMNAGISFVTQNCDDLSDEKMKNNIGMKFAFRSTDPQEIRKTLAFMGLEYTSQNEEMLKNLENGTCLYCDIYGRCGVIRIDCVFREWLDGFDTRPPVQKAG